MVSGLFSCIYSRVYFIFIVTVLSSLEICPHYIVGSLVYQLQGCDADGLLGAQLVGGYLDFR